MVMMKKVVKYRVSKRSPMFEGEGGEEWKGALYNPTLDKLT
jgi:hypothetical protein